MKKKLLFLLVLCLVLPTGAGCDREDDPNVGQDPSSDSYTEVTEETDTEEESTDTVPELDFGPLLENLDFSDLAQSTFGQEYADALNERFLNSVNQNPEQVLHDGEAGNYFRVLTSEAGEKRHNIMLEITNTDQKKWVYFLISTEDDFAVVAKDSKKKKTYAVGFADGDIVDQLNYIDETDRELLSSMISEYGYDAVLNQVRNEFFGRLSKLTEDGGEGYKLGFTGKTHNMWGEDNTLNPIEDRDYTMSEIQLVNAEDISEVYTSMEATYDIPNDHLDTIIGSKDEKGNAGREVQ
jgi:hypothetical protein